MRENQNFQVYSIFVSLVIYLCLILVLIFSFGSFLNFLKKTEQKTIVEGMLLPRTNFPLNTTFNVDPLLTNSSVDSIRDIRKSVSSLIFSSLFHENPDGTMSQDLVEKYEFSNAQVLVLNLRKDVKWHDGTPLNASDVQFTINTIKGIGQSTIYTAAVNGNDSQIELIDEYTLKITLAGADGPRPSAAYIHTLTFPVLPKHILENYPKPSLSLLSETEFGKKPIGSGILKYNENRIDQLSLARNENYYEGAVGFDNYIFRFYRDYDKLIEDYKLKNVDLIRRMETGSKDDVFENLIKLGMNYEERVIRSRRLVLYFNLGNKAADASQFTKSTLLRRALLNVIDRNSLVASVDIAKATYGPIDDDSVAFWPDVLQKQTRNVEAFDKTVTGLGYSKVDGIYQKDNAQLKFTLTYLNGGIRSLVVNELKRQLQEVGVKMVANPISDVDEATSDDPTAIQKESFYSIVNNREYDALLTAIDHFMDPDVYNEWHSTKIAAPGLNLSGYSSKIADRTLEDGRVKVGEERKADYLRFQKTFFEELPAIYLLNPGMQVFHSPKISIVGNKEITEEIDFYRQLNKWEVKVRESQS